MKNLCSLLIFLVFISVSAQEKLKITYEGNYSLDETNSTNKKISRNFVPTTFELIIDGNFSEFKYIEKLTNQPEELGIVMQLTSDNFFINLKENKYFVEEKIFNKKYLISDSIRKLDWKIEKETKEIAGFSARKASVIIKEEDRDSQLTVYYAPKLPYKIGPELYGGLPGLILQLDLFWTSIEGSVVGEHYKAVKIEVLNDNYKIKLPKGKTISYEESESIADEHFEKIKEMHQGEVDKD